MLKRIKDSIFDILRQADWLLLCLCCGAALFGLVMIASATNFLNSWKMVIVQACAIMLGVGIYFLMSQIDLTEAAKVTGPFTVEQAAPAADSAEGASPVTVTAAELGQAPAKKK